MECPRRGAQPERYSLLPLEDGGFPPRRFCKGPQPPGGGHTAIRAPLPCALRNPDFPSELRTSYTVTDSSEKFKRRDWRVDFRLIFSRSPEGASFPRGTSTRNPGDISKVERAGVTWPLPRDASMGSRNQNVQQTCSGACDVPMQMQSLGIGLLGIPIKCYLFKGPGEEDQSLAVRSGWEEGMMLKRQLPLVAQRSPHLTVLPSFFSRRKRAPLGSLPCPCPKLH